MNYLKVYCNLIRKAENRIPPEDYTEKHHVFPKSVFGNNNKIVVLTSKEHYIAHALLEKVFIKRYGLKDKKTIKMTYAFWFMNNKKNHYYNSRLYECVKIRQVNSRVGYRHSEESKRKMSESLKGRVSANKGKPMSLEQKLKLSEVHKGKVSPKKGKPISLEQKLKISESLRGHKQSEETKKKRSDSRKGYNHREESKNRMIESNNKKWKCLITGHISNSSGLSRYQRARGIDTSQRVGVE